MRTIKPGFFKNDALCSLTPLARILFEGLWCYCDREGRCEDRPVRIKAEVLPYDDCDVDGLLSALHKARFIVRYERDGLQLICVPAFKQHQRPHVKEAPSYLPEHIEHLPRKVRARTKVVPSTDQGDGEPAQSLGARTGTGTHTPESPPSGAPACNGAEKNGKSKQHPEALPVCEYLSRAIAHWKPDAKAVETVTLASSLDEMDRLFRVDHRSPQRAREIIDWIFSDEEWSFHPRGTFDWRSNVLSGGALRKHWDRLDNEARIALTNERDRL